MKPHYWDDARIDLARRDPVLGRVIAAWGEEHLTTRGDPFVTLVRSIVGQQISVKAAQTIWDRLAKAARTVTPDRVARMRVSSLRSVGLSARKAEYLKDLARHFRSGSIDPGRWADLDDETLIGELTAVRGIGRWTAEMLLIFNLQRPDVFPADDVGLLRGISVTFCAGEAISRRDALAMSDRWRPWRSVASWYLWRSLDPLPVDY